MGSLELELELGPGEARGGSSSSLMERGEAKGSSGGGGRDARETSLLAAENIRPVDQWTFPFCSYSPPITHYSALYERLLFIFNWQLAIYNFKKN